MSHLERRRVVELARLLLYRFGDLRPAVARVRAPQARRAVEHLAPVSRDEMHVARRDEHARRFLELPVRRERHPERIER